MRLDYKTVKDFIENNSDCKLISSDYKNNREKLELQCGCGNIFTVSFDNFKSRNQRQCKSCGTKISIEKQKLNKDYVINFIESNSNCKLISEYNSFNSNDLQIKCECGNVFTTSFNHFKNDNVRRCNNCTRELMSKLKRLDDCEVRHLIESNNCKWIDGKYRNDRSKLTLECECGNIFKTNIQSFRTLNKRRCDVCSKSQTKGSLKIEEWLLENNITNIREYRFKDCKDKYTLPFDFVVFNNDKLICLIEFDGEQHYKPIKVFGGDYKFDKTKKHDEIKNEYCKINNIKLIRIPYWEIKNISSILEYHLKIYL